jgi:hypothetical protein
MGGGGVANLGTISTLNNSGAISGGAASTRQRARARAFWSSLCLLATPCAGVPTVFSFGPRRPG